MTSLKTRILESLQSITSADIPYFLKAEAAESKIEDTWRIKILLQGLKANSQMPLLVTGDTKNRWVDFVLPEPASVESATHLARSVFVSNGTLQPAKSFFDTENNTTIHRVGVPLADGETPYVAQREVLLSVVRWLYFKMLHFREVYARCNPSLPEDMRIMLSEKYTKLMDREQEAVAAVCPWKPTGATPLTGDILKRVVDGMAPMDSIGRTVVEDDRIVLLVKDADGDDRWPLFVHGLGDELPVATRLVVGSALPPPAFDCDSAKLLLHLASLGREDAFAGAIARQTTKDDKGEIQSGFLIHGDLICAPGAPSALDVSVLERAVYDLVRSAYASQLVLLRWNLAQSDDLDEEEKAAMFRAVMDKYKKLLGEDAPST